MIGPKMVKLRLIATLLVYHGDVVQTRRFRRTNMVGSPITAVDFFNSWTVDEIMVLDISGSRERRNEFHDVVADLSRRCFVPLGVGGLIASLDDVRELTMLGADKVVVNSAALEHPELLTEISSSFGSQALVVSIDLDDDPQQPSGFSVFTHNARIETHRDAVSWAREAVRLGAGELMVNHRQFDGDKRGYNLAAVRAIAEAVDVPVIAMGGVGEWQHLVDGLTQGQVDAVAAGNIFHYTEHSTKRAKAFLEEAGVPVRKSVFYKLNMPRRPKYLGQRRTSNW